MARIASVYDEGIFAKPEYLCNKVDMQEFETAQDMVESNCLKVGYAHTLGFYEVGDGGEAYYRVVANPTGDKPNGMDVLQGRRRVCELMIFGTMNTKAIGCKSGKIDSKIINRLLNADCVIFNGESYVVSPTEGFENPCISVPSNTMIIGNGASFSIEANNYDKYAVIAITNSENVYIENINVFGDLDKHQSEAGQQGHGLRIYFSKNVTCENIHCENCHGDGINIANEYKINGKICENVNIYNATCIKNYRQGMSIEGGNNIVVDGFYASQVKGQAPQAGIDIEPSEIDGVPFENVTVILKNIRTENTTGAGVLIDLRNSLGNDKISFYDVYTDVIRILSTKDSAINWNNLTVNAKEKGNNIQINTSENCKIVMDNILVEASETNADVLVYTDTGIFGNTTLNNVIMYPTVRKALVYCSTFTEGTLAGLNITNLLCNENVAISTYSTELEKTYMSATVNLAKNVTIKTISDYFVINRLCNAVLYDSLNAPAFIEMPFGFNDQEITIYNTTDYLVSIEHVTNYPPIFRNDLHTDDIYIKIKNGYCKLKFNSKLKAWIVREFVTSE